MRSKWMNRALTRLRSPHFYRLHQHTFEALPLDANINPSKEKKTKNNVRCLLYFRCIRNFQVIFSILSVFIFSQTELKLHMNITKWVAAFCAKHGSVWLVIVFDTRFKNRISIRRLLFGFFFIEIFIIRPCVVVAAVQKKISQIYRYWP